MSSTFFAESESSPLYQYNVPYPYQRKLIGLPTKSMEEKRAQSAPYGERNERNEFRNDGKRTLKPIQTDALNDPDTHNIKRGKSAPSVKNSKVNFEFTDNALTTDGEEVILTKQSNEENDPNIKNSFNQEPFNLDSYSDGLDEVDTLQNIDPSLLWLLDVTTAIHSQFDRQAQLTNKHMSILDSLLNPNTAVILTESAAPPPSSPMKANKSNSNLAVTIDENDNNQDLFSHTIQKEENHNFAFDDNNDIPLPTNYDWMEGLPEIDKEKVQLKSNKSDKKTKNKKQKHGKTKLLFDEKVVSKSPYLIHLKKNHVDVTHPISNAVEKKPKKRESSPNKKSIAALDTSSSPVQTMSFAASLAVAPLPSKIAPLAVKREERSKWTLETTTLAYRASTGGAFPELPGTRELNSRQDKINALDRIITKQSQQMFDNPATKEAIYDLFSNENLELMRQKLLSAAAVANKQIQVLERDENNEDQFISQPILTAPSPYPLSRANSPYKDQFSSDQNKFSNDPNNDNNDKNNDAKLIQFDSFRSMISQDDGDDVRDDNDNDMDSLTINSSSDESSKFFFNPNSRNHNKKSFPNSFNQTKSKLSPNESIKSKKSDFEFSLLDENNAIESEALKIQQKHRDPLYNILREEVDRIERKRMMVPVNAHNNKPKRDSQSARRESRASLDISTSIGNSSNGNSGNLNYGIDDDLVQQNISPSEIRSFSSFQTLPPAVWVTSRVVYFLMITYHRNIVRQKRFAKLRATMRMDELWDILEKHYQQIVNGEGGSVDSYYCWSVLRELLSVPVLFVKAIKIIEHGHNPKFLKVNKTVANKPDDDCSMNDNMPTDGSLDQSANNDDDIYENWSELFYETFPLPLLEPLRQLVGQGMALFKQEILHSVPVSAKLCNWAKRVIANIYSASIKKVKSDSIGPKVAATKIPLGKGKRKQGGIQSIQLQILQSFDTSHAKHLELTGDGSNGAVDSSNISIQSNSESTARPFSGYGKLPPNMTLISELPFPNSLPEMLRLATNISKLQNYNNKTNTSSLVPIAKCFSYAVSLAKPIDRVDLLLTGYEKAVLANRNSMAMLRQYKRDIDGRRINKREEELLASGGYSEKEIQDLVEINERFIKEYYEGVLRGLSASPLHRVMTSQFHSHHNHHHKPKENSSQKLLTVSFNQNDVTNEVVQDGKNKNKLISHDPNARMKGEGLIDYAGRISRVTECVLLFLPMPHGRLPNETMKKRSKHKKAAVDYTVKFSLVLANDLQHSRSKQTIPSDDYDEQSAPIYGERVLFESGNQVDNSNSYEYTSTSSLTNVRYVVFVTDTRSSWSAYQLTSRMAKPTDTIILVHIPFLEPLARPSLVASSAEKGIHIYNQSGKEGSPMLSSVSMASYTTQSRACASRIERIVAFYKTTGLNVFIASDNNNEATDAANGYVPGYFDRTRSVLSMRMVDQTIQSQTKNSFRRYSLMEKNIIIEEDSSIINQSTIDTSSIQHTDLLRPNNNNSSSRPLLSDLIKSTKYSFMHNVSVIGLVIRMLKVLSSLDPTFLVLGATSEEILSAAAGIIKDNYDNHDELMNDNQDNKNGEKKDENDHNNEDLLLQWTPSYSVKGGEEGEVDVGDDTFITSKPRNNNDKDDNPDSPA
eukprot:gene13487-18097_t